MLDRILELSRESEATVGIGSATDGDRAEEAATRAMGESPGTIKVFRRPEELVAALVEDRVDAAVRGTLSAHAVFPHLLEAAGVQTSGRAALMDLGGGRTFLLTPVGIDEGRDLAERWSLLSAAADLVSSLGSPPRVAVMSLGRDEDADRGKAISLSIRECQALRDAATAEGIAAECVGIRIERAVEACNLVVAPDGVTGNLVFRSLHLVAGHDSWGAVALVLRPLVFVDTSREKADYLGAIHLARAVTRAWPR